MHGGVLPDDETVAVLDLIRFRANGDYHRRELLRVGVEDSWFVDRAAQEFNRALDGYGVDAVFNAARLWTSGYDIFSPTHSLLGHHYVRNHKPKFWESAPVPWRRENLKLSV